LAWALLETGDAEQAARTIAGASEHLRSQQNRLHLVDALWVQALVALRQGESRAAKQALEEGLRMARGLPYPQGEGRLLQVYGQLYLASDESAAARGRLNEAAAIFRRLGARTDTERTERLLATLG
jgi:hypothetical protein